MKKLLSIFFIMSILLLSTVTSLKANSSTDPNKPVPYLTYTTGPSNTMVLTQTAYEPAGIINYNVNLNKPKDVFIKDDFIYIADTGNQRVIKLNRNGDLVFEYKDSFIEPTGIFVDDEYLYVADPKAEKVFKYELDGTLNMEYSRPTAPLFGDSPYRPLKLVVGARGIMYIVGEGSNSGLIQINHRGDFVGFFGTNTTERDFYNQLLRFFGIRQASTLPPSPDNVAIDDKGSVYTISKTPSKQVKKFNIASEDRLNINISLTELQSITIGNHDNIYILSSSGVIQEYDSFGNLIFSFGGKLKSTDTKRPGVFQTPVAIAVDSNSNLYVLDQATNNLEYLEKTDFTELVHEGINSYKEGKYDVGLWEEVLKKNTMFALANSSIGQGLYRLKDYKGAAEYFEIAGDIQGYSDSFWQIRYNWMQSYLVYVILGIIVLFAMVKVLKLVDNKFGIYDPIRRFNNKSNQYKLIRDLKIGKEVFKHPIDTFYDIKQARKGSYWSATILYGLFILVSILSFYFTSFIFRSGSLESYSILRTIGISVGVIVLFVFSNYLIATLSDGIGWFRDIYVSTAYALLPYIIGSLPLAIVSRYFTLNEAFIYSFTNGILIGWSVLLVVLAIKSVHDYSLKDLIKNLLLTIFTMIIIAVILIIIYILFNQFYEFIYGIIKEVVSRGQTS